MKTFYQVVLRLFFIFISTMRVHGMDHYDVQDVSKLQTLAGQKALALELEKRINLKKQLSNSEFKVLRAHGHVCAEVLNNDICDDEDKVVLQKGELLYKSVRANHLQMVSLLLSVGVKPHQLGHDSLLHEAAFYGNKRIVKLLLGRNIAVDKRNGFGFTPLRYASNKGHVNIVKLLLDHGANVNLKDKPGRTPLYGAVVYRGGCIDAVELLLDHGANVNTIDGDGETLFHYYARDFWSDINIAELLIDRGADMNVSSNKYCYLNDVNFRETPLDIAIYRGDVDRASMLIDLGAYIKIESPKGKVLLNYAHDKGYSDMVSCLIAHDIDTVEKDLDENEMDLDENLWGLCDY